MGYCLRVDCLVLCLLCLLFRFAIWLVVCVCFNSVVEDFFGAVWVKLVVCIMCAVLI